jgi:hypothetical protein
MREAWPPVGEAAACWIDALKDLATDASRSPPRERIEQKCLGISTCLAGIRARKQTRLTFPCKRTVV